MVSRTDAQPCALPPAGLPLTAFEEFMLLDDRPSHPMAIVARFDFADGPPPPGLAEAFGAALRQEPLLTARIVRPPRGRPRWVAAEPPALEVAEIAAGESVPPLRRIDPARGPMIGATLVERASDWSIVVAVHHAACDGLGLLGFVERWFLRAAGREGRRGRDPADTLAAVDKRGRVAGSWREFLGLLPRLAKGLEGVGQFVSREVASLTDRPPGAGASSGTEGAAADAWRPTILSATLDEREVERLERRARAAGVMVNDLLMTSFVATLGRHLEGRDPRHGGAAWIRLATPLSLRTKSDHRLPAANRVSMVFFDRRAADRRDEAALARSFREEMDVIRTHALGHVLPLSLEVGRWLPGGLRRTVARPQPQSTAVLSNLGGCFVRSPLLDDAGCLRVGAGRLAGWWMVPPLRPGTALAAATHETRGRRTVAFHVDAARVPPARARAWLAELVESLARDDRPVETAPGAEVAAR